MGRNRDGLEEYGTMADLEEYRDTQTVMIHVQYRTQGALANLSIRSLGITSPFF